MSNNLLWPVNFEVDPKNHHPCPAIRLCVRYRTPLRQQWQRPHPAPRGLVSLGHNLLSDHTGAKWYPTQHICVICSSTPINLLSTEYRGNQRQRRNWVLKRIQLFRNKPTEVKIYKWQDGKYLRGYLLFMMMKKGGGGEGILFIYMYIYRYRYIYIHCIFVCILFQPSLWNCFF